jgi:hypothetical protein
MKFFHIPYDSQRKYIKTFSLISPLIYILFYSIYILIFNNHVSIINITIGFLFSYICHLPILIFYLKNKKKIKKIKKKILKYDNPIILLKFKSGYWTISKGQTLSLKANISFSEKDIFNQYDGWIYHYCVYDQFGLDFDLNEIIGFCDLVDDLQETRLKKLKKIKKS